MVTQYYGAVRILHTVAVQIAARSSNLTQNSHGICHFRPFNLKNYLLGYTMHH